MKIGMIGLGKMGANMADRLLPGGHEVVGYELHGGAVDEAVGRGAVGAEPVDELVPAADAPIIGLSLMGRVESRDEVEFADRLLPSMRKGFGGHAVIAEGTSNG